MPSCPSGNIKLVAQDATGRPVLTVFTVLSGPYIGEYNLNLN